MKCQKNCTYDWCNLTNILTTRICHLRTTASILRERRILANFLSSGLANFLWSVKNAPVAARRVVWFRPIKQRRLWRVEKTTSIKIRDTFGSLTSPVSEFRTFSFFFAHQCAFVGVECVPGRQSSTIDRNNHADYGTRARRTSWLLDIRAAFGVSALAESGRNYADHANAEIDCQWMATIQTSQLYHSFSHSRHSPLQLLHSLDCEYKHWGAAIWLGFWGGNNDGIKQFWVLEADSCLDILESRILFSSIIYLSMRNLHQQIFGVRRAIAQTRSGPICSENELVDTTSLSCCLQYSGTSFTVVLWSHHVFHAVLQRQPSTHCFLLSKLVGPNYRDNTDLFWERKPRCHLLNRTPKRPITNWERTYETQRTRIKSTIISTTSLHQLITYDGNNPWTSSWRRSYSQSTGRCPW